MRVNIVVEGEIIFATSLDKAKSITEIESNVILLEKENVKIKL